MPDWLAVEARYRAGELTVREICQRHGVSQRDLYRRARQCGWPLRRAPRQPDQDNAKSASPGQTSRSSRRRLISRLFKNLETQMQSIEHRLNGQSTAPALSAADRERDARTLSALVRTMEKLCELESAAGTELEVAKAAQRHVEKDPAQFERDIEDLRQALTRRIAGLAPERND